MTLINKSDIMMLFMHKSLSFFHVISLRVGMFLYPPQMLLKEMIKTYHQTKDIVYLFS